MYLTIALAARALIIPIPPALTINTTVTAANPPPEAVVHPPPIQPAILPSPNAQSPPCRPTAAVTTATTATTTKITAPVPSSQTPPTRSKTLSPRPTQPVNAVTGDDLHIRMSLVRSRVEVPSITTEVPGPMLVANILRDLMNQSDLVIVLVRSRRMRREERSRLNLLLRHLFLRLVVMEVV